MLRFFVPQSSLKIEVVDRGSQGMDLEIETPRGGVYRAQEIAGQGSLDIAHVYRATDRAREFVVLSPIRVKDLDKMSVIKKLNFFKTMYGEESLQLFYIKDRPDFGYRFILPKIPGLTLYELSKQGLHVFKNLQQFILLGLDALARCHRMGIVYIDFNLGNILCEQDSTTGQWRQLNLIDGGLSSQIGKPVSNVFQCTDHGQRAQKIRHYYHIAPECWYLSRSPLADPSMDVYSFAKIVEFLFYKHQKQIPAELYAILASCQAYDPSLRPCMNQLMEQIRGLDGALFEDYYQTHCAMM
jgi:serine/threonine protein kinase